MMHFCRSFIYTIIYLIRLTLTLHYLLSSVVVNHNPLCSCYRDLSRFSRRVTHTLTPAMAYEHNLLHPKYNTINYKFRKPFRKSPTITQNTGVLPNSMLSSPITTLSAESKTSKSKISIASI